jgi:hypothetical protein
MLLFFALAIVATSCKKDKDGTTQEKQALSQLMVFPIPAKQAHKLL